MRWGDFKEDRLLILDQAMFVEVPSARFVGNVLENMIAEGEALLLIGFFAEGLLQNPGHKGSIFGWLFLRVNLSKNSPQLRSQSQRILEIFIDECFVYAGRNQVDQVIASYTVKFNLTGSNQPSLTIIPYTSFSLNSVLIGQHYATLLE
jgi:hypothetical protein